MLPCVVGCLHRAVGTRVSLGGDSAEVDVFLLCSSAEDCTMKPGCPHGSPCTPISCERSSSREVGRSCSAMD